MLNIFLVDGVDPLFSAFAYLVGILFSLWLSSEIDCISSRSKAVEETAQAPQSQALEALPIDESLSACVWDEHDEISSSTGTVELPTVRYKGQDAVRVEDLPYSLPSSVKQYRLRKKFVVLLSALQEPSLAPSAS